MARFCMSLTIGLAVCSHPARAQDCNTNGIPDSTDIANMTSPDCNTNGTPDECDIANCMGDPACGDCNTNGVPDACDLIGEPVMPGLTLWLRADAGVTADAQGVILWADQSGLGNDFAPEPGQGKPALVPNVINGRPVVRFDGVNDRMLNTGQLITGNQFTIFTVHSVISGDYPWELGGGLFSRVSYERGQFGGASPDLLDIAHDNSNDVRASFPGISASGFRIIAVLGDQTLINTSVFVDGAAAATSLTGANLTWTLGGGQNRLGGATNVPNPFALVEVAEFLGYDRLLTPLERQQVETYLSGRFFSPTTAGDCNTNGTPDDCDIAGGLSQDCNVNTTPDECELATDDCNGNSTPDDCDIAGGISQDCDADGTPDECQPDCNANGTADTCDIAGMTSPDCNTNGTPDECEIDAASTAPGGPFFCTANCDPDCNNNGVPDACDIAGMTSQDCNGNGTPDECEPFQPILFVDASATGANNGQSWSDAFNDLQDALAFARISCGVVEQIWVAQGTYRPVTCQPGPCGPMSPERNISFELVGGVSVFGGFPSGGGDGSFNARNPALFTQTILSGDLNADDTGAFPNVIELDDNSRHVLTFAGGALPATVDGFQIQGGNADATVSPDDKGAAILHPGGTLILGNCTLTHNFSALSAGIDSRASLTMSDCTIIENKGDKGTGLSLGTGGTAILSNCDFVRNHSTTVPGSGSTVEANGADTLTLQDCSFTLNESNRTTGIRAVSINAVDLRDCTFSDNISRNDGSRGGGLSASAITSVTVTSCVFSNNVSNFGAGLDVASVPSCEIVDCTFDSNDGGPGFNQAGGGSALFAGQSTVRCVRCIFQNNFASHKGGAVWLVDGSLDIVNSRFTDNRVGGGSIGQGGAVYAASGSVNLVNCELFGNAELSGPVDPGGGAVSIDAATVQLTNCSLVGNSAATMGGGVLVFLKGGSVIVRNCILRDNTDASGSGESAQIHVADGVASVQFSNIEGLLAFGAEPGNIDADPLFVLANTDLRLQSGSPCIDAGDSTAVPTEQELGVDVDGDGVIAPVRVPVDLDGNPRFLNDSLTPDTGLGDPDDPGLPVVDMGAYEFRRVDCDGNGTPDECDADCNNPGCDLLFPNCGGIVDCNANGTPDSCDVAGGESFDCLGDGTPDECQSPTGVLASVWVGGTNCLDSMGQPIVDKQCWNSSPNWCPDTVPDNSAGSSFNVLIDGLTSVATLNISPTLGNLTLLNMAAVEVNDASGANVRTLSVDGTIQSEGVLRATDLERLVIDAPEINQVDLNPDCGLRGGGLLTATQGVPNGPGTPDLPGAKSILEINGARVIGGRAVATDPDSEIHLIGGAELVDVCVEGVVVPDGQVGSFAGTLTNDGLLQVAPDGAQATFFSPTLAGGTLQGAVGGVARDCVRLGGQTVAQLGNFKSSFTNELGHFIDGAGIIFGGMTNRGTIEANFPDGQHLILFPPGVKVNDGTMMATGGGVLRIADTVTNNGDIIARDDGMGGVSEVRIVSLILGLGRIIAQGGLVTIESGASVTADCFDVPPGSTSFMDIGEMPSGAATASASLMNITGGIVNVNGGSTLSVAGTLNIRPDTAADPAAVAELHINGSTLNAGTIDIGPGGVLIVASNVNLSDSFRNAMTDGSTASWDWDASAVLTLSGGQSADPTPGSLVGWATLEAASEDNGAVPTGGDNNFGFAQIDVLAGAHVSLVDFNDNGGATNAEAVYCGGLTLGAGAVLNLNDPPVPMYVAGNPVVADPAACPCPFGGGMIVSETRAVAGDACGDGTMGEADIACFVEVLLGTDTERSHMVAADVNTDGTADARDVQMFIEALMGGV